MTIRDRMRTDCVLVIGMVIIGVLVGVNLLLRVGVMLGWWPPFPGA